VTGIFPCSCKHAFQDERYGHGQRVHNFGPKAGPNEKMEGWRCTVCGQRRGVDQKAGGKK